MQPFRFHVFVCDQQKPEGVPSCAARGSGQVLEALRRVRGNRTHAARLLGISLRTLRNKLREYREKRISMKSSSS